MDDGRGREHAHKRRKTFASSSPSQGLSPAAARGDERHARPARRPHETHASPSAAPDGGTGARVGAGAGTAAFAQERRKLPIYAARDALVQAVEQSRTLILVGETGSGKTTQLPQFLLESGLLDRLAAAASVKGSKRRRSVEGTGKAIAITQPRRVAAITVAQRVALESGCKLGTKVGYKIRFDDMTSAESRLVYLTDGMLLREAIVDPLLSRYAVVILDEAHERTIDTDILFGLVKALQKRRADLRVVVMSATLDAARFSEYFDQAEIVHVQGRQHPVQILYTAEPEADWLDAALITVLQIHLDEGASAGDVLVFLTGQAEIEALAELLEERGRLLPDSAMKLLVCPLFAALAPEQQLAAFAPTPAGCRKIVLATNIAETSVTINGIRHVVDPGLVKTRCFNPRLGIESLMVLQTSKAQARQRAGRAGRDGPGRAYRLYCEVDFAKLMDTTIPEIKRANLASVILQLKALGVDDVLNFDYLDPPSDDALAAALETLYALAALDGAGKLTVLGRRMAVFPLDPEFARMLLASHELGCSEEIVTIVAMLSTENIFVVPKEARDTSAAVLRRYASPEGDHLTLLNVYRTYHELAAGPGSAVKWCRDSLVSRRALLHATDVRAQLVKLCRTNGVEMHASGDVDAIKRALLAGFFRNAAVLQPDKSYRALVAGKDVAIHPSSVLAGAKKAEAVVFNELVLTSKQYMRTVTRIPAHWLAEVAPSVYAAATTTTTGAASAVAHVPGAEDQPARQPERRFDLQQMAAAKREAALRDGRNPFAQ